MWFTSWVPPLAMLVSSYTWLEKIMKEEKRNWAWWKTWCSGVCWLAADCNDGGGIMSSLNFQAFLEGLWDGFLDGYMEGMHWGIMRWTAGRVSQGMVWWMKKKDDREGKVVWIEIVVGRMLWRMKDDKNNVLKDCRRSVPRDGNKMDVWMK